jgi:hypothetical protein
MQSKRDGLPSRRAAVAACLCTMLLLAGCDVFPTVNDGLESAEAESARVETPTTAPKDKKTKRRSDAAPAPRSGAEVPTESAPAPADDPEPADSPAPAEEPVSQADIPAPAPADSSGRFSCPRPVRHEATRVVGSSSGLRYAVDSAVPGDVIELRGGTVFTDVYPISGLSGTRDRPIVITTDPSNPAIIDARRDDPYGLSIIDSEWIEISNLSVRNAKYAGMVFGDAYGQGGRSVQHVVVSHNEISQPGQAGLQVNDNSGYVDIMCNEIHDTGWYKPQYGEGVYLGVGSTTDDNSHNITVRGNHIYDTRSEAVDVKARVYNVDITDNHIHHVNVASQGAITVGLNEVWYRSGEYRIERNVIHDVTSRQYDGAAIWVGHGDTLVANNVMWNLPHDEAISTSTDFANQDANAVGIFYNSIWNAPDGALAMNSTNSGGGPISMASHDVRNNVAPDRSMGAGNFVARSADFVAPTGATMDAGDGLGSGLALKPEAPMADSATALSSVVTDIEQRRRDATPDPGAFETP